MLYEVITAVDGLPMGTRCGAIDPGVLLYLMDERGMDARAIEKLIYQQSGLLGVSGISSDMRRITSYNVCYTKLLRRMIGSPKRRMRTRCAHSM